MRARGIPLTSTVGEPMMIAVRWTDAHAHAANGSRGKRRDQHRGDPGETTGPPDMPG